MSETAMHAALSRMNMKEQFVAPHYTGLADDMIRMGATNPQDANERFKNEVVHELCEAYGFPRREQGKPFAYADGVAIIPVHGTLINRFGATYGWVTGYNFIRAQHNAAIIDPDVHTIIHDHNSYGGEAAGCFELADEIYKSRSVKPTYAVVDSNCYSASFALASAATKLFVIPSAGVGSIGVVAMHVDMSKALDKFGVVITFIHSGDHKVDGNPYQELSAEVKADIQAGVDKSRAKFVALVARNLGLDSKIVHNTEARTYRAEDALELGLVHAIAVPSAVLQTITEDETADADESDTQLSTQKEHTMDNNQPAAGQPAAAVQPAAAAAPAAAAGAAAPAVVDQAAIQKAERERISGITGCEEAAGRGALANHLAFNTSMSVDDAKVTLAASGKDAAPVAEKNPLDAAMAASGGGAKVGSDNAAAAAANGEQPKHLAILNDYQQATGRAPAQKAAT